MDVLKNTGTGVRVFHGATITRPVDIYLNDKLIIKNLNYRMASKYTALPSGRYNIKIYDSESGGLLYNETINIDGNKFITLSAISESGKLKLIVLEDYMVNRQFINDYRTNLISENTIKRVVDAFNNVVEVVVNRVGVIVENVKDQFGNIIIQAGARIKRILDRIGNVLEVVVNKVGKVIAVVLNEVSTVMEGILERIGNTIQKVVDQFGNIVDVIVDDFENIVGWVIDELGDLFNPSDEADVAPSIPNTLTTPITPTLIPPMTNNKNQAHLRLVHLSPNSPSIDLTLPDTTRFFMDTKYKEATNYNPIGINTRNLQIRTMGTNQVILNIPNLNFIPNKLYTLYIIGLINGTPKLEAILLQDGI